MLIHPMAERLRGLGLTAMADAFIEMQNNADGRRSLPRGLARPAARPRGDAAARTSGSAAGCARHDCGRTR